MKLMLIIFILSQKISTLNSKGSPWETSQRAQSAKGHKSFFMNAAIEAEYRDGLEQLFSTFFTDDPQNVSILGYTVGDPQVVKL